MPTRLRSRLWLVAGFLYLLLLGYSHWLSRDAGLPPLAAEMRGLEVRTGPRGTETVRLAWRQWGEMETGGPLPLLLLHGSPGSHRDFDGLAAALKSPRLLVAPDLPGFGASRSTLPDYSVRAHARYVLELLDELGIDRFHSLGFSMGGGVALELSRLAPERTASLVLLSSIGVQEMELLGSYSLNHMIHALQLGGLWLLHEAVPHMGRLDGFPLDVAYARNFYDTDQRPLRDLLASFQPPALIVHGREDFLVPPEAALEHYRLMPHSRLELLEAGHFFVFEPRPGVSQMIEDFLGRVERGEAPRRSDASLERLRRAADAYDPSSAPHWVGPALLVALLLLAIATFVSEDLTCIGTGLLVAQGRLELVPGALACFVGIFVGDLLLYAAGRYLGRPVLGLPPLRWWVTEAAVEESSTWFRQRGAMVIGLGRFLPGTRLPTYLAAGILKIPILRCAFYFLLAAAVWTPLLVGGALVAGSTALEHVESFQRRGLILLIVLVAILWAIRGVMLPALSWRGRRRLLGHWKRWTRWEYWPAWLLYPPLLVYIVYLGIRHRGLTVFTATNPAMPAGGLIGESKAEILAGLAGTGDAVPEWRLLSGSTVEEKIADLRDFQSAVGTSYPLILKPDVGQRGSGVALVDDESAAAAHLRTHRGAFLAQRYVEGPEFSVFYYRRPSWKHGRIFSITEKESPSITGDGRRTVEDLVLADARAVALAKVYARELGQRWHEIPEEGVRVGLAVIGAHSRGTIFRDGSHLWSEALAARVDQLSRTYDGFYFGRYDFRAPSVEDFVAGRGLRILELNGVTSDSTDIYDPKNGYFRAYRKLLRQWRLAFEIGAECRARGAEITSVGTLVRLIISNRRYLP